MRYCLIAIVLVLAALTAGCLQPSPSPVPTPVPAESRYAPGDLLTGDLAGAGFDEPNGTPDGAAIVVLEYRPVPGEYVYTLVQPVPEGWAYVYPSGDFISTLARDRSTFESYSLARSGSVDLREIRAPPADAAPRPT